MKRIITSKARIGGPFGRDRHLVFVLFGCSEKDLSAKTTAQTAVTPDQGRGSQEEERSGPDKHGLEVHEEHGEEDHGDHGDEVAAGHGEGHADQDEEGHAGHDEHGEEVVKLSPAELEEFGIELQTAAAGSLDQYAELPGEIVLNADRLAHVVPRVSGIVRQV